MKLVHWNVGGRPERDGVAGLLVAERADLYVLTEVVNDRHVALFLEELADPAYRAETFGELAVVGRGEIRVADGPVDRGDVQMRSVAWRHAGRSVELLVVDLPSSVLVARDPLLREVTAVIADRRPDVVVGDFNARGGPGRLADLPAGYAHAYHSAGGGWGYTWPVPAPVYAIDQCLHGPRVAPVRYRLGGMGGASDHRMQVFEFSLKPGGG